MISSPCVIDFELIVMQFAIELLQLYIKKLQEAPGKSADKLSVMEDIKALEASKDFAAYTVCQYNI